MTSSSSISGKQEAVAATAPGHEARVSETIANPKTHAVETAVDHKAPGSPTPAAPEEIKRIYNHPGVYDPVGCTVDMASEYHSPGTFPPHSWEQRKHEEQLPHAPKLARPATNSFGRQQAKERAEREGTFYDQEAADAEEKAESEKPGPGELPRKCTWKYDDVKRARHERYLLGGKPNWGYTVDGEHKK